MQKCVIGLIFLIFAQATSTHPTASQQEIVVTARRLKEWRGTVSGQATSSRCKTTRSTGDKDLDRVACDSLRYCLANAQPSIQAIRKAATTGRSRLLEELSRELERCGEMQQQLRAAALVEQHWKKGSGVDDNR